MSSDVARVPTASFGNAECGRAGAMLGLPSKSPIYQEYRGESIAEPKYAIALAG